MLRIERITKQSATYRQMLALYEDAFPRNERISLNELLDGDAQAGETLAFFDDNTFVGFACVLNSEVPISHIIFLAVDPNLRDHGYGSQILQAIHVYKAHRKIIVDIEREDEHAPNHYQRHQRRQFYLRNGYQPTAVCYRWHDEDYEIMVYGGELGREEYEAFWQQLRLNPDRY